ncbi:MAG: response regulator [Oscillospiraceae bacterium]|jgi:YesN/AraC family two-component response regulator|nr:response regulator [Oscillospiraceae bacterium]
MRSVLIADDESIILKGLSEYIPWDTVGCAVSAAVKDGHEAIEAIKSNPPDIVITDIKMPRKSGLDVARFVHENCPNIQVIILTGFAEFEYARQAIAYGVAEYALKPVSKDSLLESVDRLLQKAATEQKPEQRVRRYRPLVEKSMRHIRIHYKENLSLESIAALIPANPSHLSRTFKKDTGESLTEYISRFRVEKAKELLTETDMLAYEVAEAVGFNDPTYFSLVFKRYAGVSPKDFRRG